MSPSAPELLTLRLPDGRQLGVARFGNPTAPALVYQHGFGTSGWGVPPDENLLHQLGLQILAPDRPGVGDSDLDPRLSFESFAADVVFMLDALAVPGPVGVLGWSVGGIYALALAARYPLRVASLQLLSTCLPLNDPAAYGKLSATWKALRWANLRAPGLSLGLASWLSGQWEQDADRTIAWFLRLMQPAEREVVAQPAHRALLREAAVRGFAHGGQGVYYDGQALCRPPQFDLSQIQAATTLWHGTADGVWAPDNIPYLRQRIPGARSRLLAGEGHMLYLRHWPRILAQAQQELGRAG
jgi:pimeloyl-ACP methyl ester carboxylesterase